MSKNYKELYEGLKKEYENFKFKYNIEKEQYDLTIDKLDKEVIILNNVMETSKYINSSMSNENLISLINDTVVGLLGVQHSNIYLLKNSELKLKASNSSNCKSFLSIRESEYIKKGAEYLINDRGGIRSCSNCDIKIKSVMGVPIEIRGELIGYIIVDHFIYGYLTEERKKFLRAICTQIAVTLENSMLYRELKEISKTDPLLGIYNRKYFFERVISDKNKHQDRDFTIVMIDLDNFKKINDTYGHQFGDKVLLTVASIITKSILQNRVFARYGGEEFIIYGPNILDKRDVYSRAENIRKKIQDTKIVLGEKEAYITASMGIAFGEYGENLADVIKRADENLYRAKSLGKNMIIFDSLE